MTVIGSWNLLILKLKVSFDSVVVVGSYSICLSWVSLPMEWSQFAIHVVHTLLIWPILVDDKGLGLGLPLKLYRSCFMSYICHFSIVRQCNTWILMKNQLLYGSDEMNLSTSSPNKQSNKGEVVITTFL